MEEIKNWYASKINKTFEEFDDYDNYIVTIIQNFDDERKRALILPVVVKSVKGKEATDLNDWVYQT